MESNRRTFIKSLGLGSGALLMDHVTLFGKQPGDDAAAQLFPNKDRNPFVTRQYETDVLIAGGGMAGVCAALAAAASIPF